MWWTQLDRTDTITAYIDEYRLQGKFVEIRPIYELVLVHDNKIIRIINGIPPRTNVEELYVTVVIYL